jgi:hypothetical protein
MFPELTADETTRRTHTTVEKSLLLTSGARKVSGGKASRRSRRVMYLEIRML